ncbi:MAG: DUF4160 domain-containing protein [Burkholderiaceae bacterium]|nr:DUF4160 domain-containing protein [Burkholderiaceae bacterium]
MPTVKRIGGFRVVIYPNDHRPAHVHVIGVDREAVFNLGCPNGPPVLRENYGCTGQEITTISNALAADITALCRVWSIIHGHR